MEDGRKIFYDYYYLNMNIFCRNLNIYWNLLLFMEILKIIHLCSVCKTIKAFFIVCPRTDGLSCKLNKSMISIYTRRIGAQFCKRPLVVSSHFIKHVPKVNKKCEMIDMIDKIPLLRNMRRARFARKVPSCFKKLIQYSECRLV